MKVDVSEIARPATVLRIRLIEKDMLEEVIVNKSRKVYVEHIVVTGRCASRRSVSQTCVYQAYYFPLLRDAMLLPRKILLKGIGLPCVCNAVSIAEFSIATKNCREE